MLLTSAVGLCIACPFPIAPDSSWGLCPSIIDSSGRSKTWRWKAEFSILSTVAENMRCHWKAEGYRAQKHIPRRQRLWGQGWNWVWLYSVIFLFLCPRILDSAVFAIGIHILKQETQVCSARPIRDISCGAYAGVYILLPTKEEEGRIILNVRLRHSFMSVRKAIPLHLKMLRSSCLFLFQWRASQMTQW